MPRGILDASLGPPGVTAWGGCEILDEFLGAREGIAYAPALVHRKAIFLQEMPEQ